MAIRFIFDEELEKSSKELEEVIDTLNEDTKTKKKAEILKTFARAAVQALQPEKPLIIQRPKIKQRPLTLLNKIFARRDIKPVVKKIPPKALPKQEVPKQPEIKKEPEIIQKDLILDKITDKVLAYVRITDKYYIIEPILDENDTKLLNKILGKHPKNMEKGWKLITKFGKKFAVSPDHFTNIKYYVVNFLYGLGKIEPLVYDKEVKEIACEGQNKPIKVKYNDKLIETNISFQKEELDNFIYELSYRVKQKIKKKNPTINFNYREMYFECTISFSPETISKFTIKK